jgi:anti-sigma regulatory factor (Ser/Thr protein kinase)
MHGDNEPGVTTSPPVDLHEDAIAPSAARTAVTEACRRWHLTDLIETTALLVSELVTNAVRHGGSAYALRLEVREGSRLYGEVFDPGDGVPHPRSPDLDALSGRGLQIVAAIADDWGVATANGGKVVWFSVDCTA